MGFCNYLTVFFWSVHPSVKTRNCSKCVFVVISPAWQINTWRTFCAILTIYPMSCRTVAFFLALFPYETPGFYSLTWHLSSSSFPPLVSLPRRTPWKSGTRRLAIPREPHPLKCCVKASLVRITGNAKTVSGFTARKRELDNLKGRRQFISKDHG